jgi:hypothetical protein
MNKKTLALIGVSTLALGAIVLSAGSIEAYRGDINVKGPNYTAERHEAMEKAFESKDFTAWQKLMEGRGRVTQVINKDNFAKFAEIHELLEDGKKDEANKLRAELGLGLQNGMGQGKSMGQGQGKGMGQGMGRMNNR